MTEAKHDAKAEAKAACPECCCDTFAHVGGRSVNMAHVIMCLWEADGSVTLKICHQPDLTLSGDDRDLIAAAVGLPDPEEHEEKKAAVKEKKETKAKAKAAKKT